MKNVYGTSFPAPENRQPDLSLPAAAAILAAPKTVSEIARLTREAYQKHRGVCVDVELLTVDRRAFLGTVFSAGALVLGANLLADRATAAAAWQPSVYLGFEPDGRIVITAHRSEMGTGSRTSLPLVVAEELDVDWKTVRVEQAIGDAKFGSQNTDGSCSVRDFVEAMHQTGATARLMLERAAAQKWGVPAAEVSLRMGKVTHAASKRSADAGRAGLDRSHASHSRQSGSPLQEPRRLPLHRQGGCPGRPAQHRHRQGSLRDGCQAPRNAVRRRWNARPCTTRRSRRSTTPTRSKVKGVQKTVQLPPFKQPHLFQQLGGVAVVADSTYAAMQGRKKLKVEWDLNPDHASFNSGRYKQELFASVHKPGNVVRNRGDFDSAFAGAARKLEADYYVPMLAHASMEPPVAVAEWQNGKVEAWCPTQDPQAVQDAVAAALGLTPKDVTCHVTLLGGGFGRKSKPDYVVEAALLSKAAGKPVKVVWTREDDMRFDYFHSVAAMHMKGGLDASGKIQSWLFRSAFPPIASTFAAGAEYGADFETGMALERAAVRRTAIFAPKTARPKTTCVRVGCAPCAISSTRSASTASSMNSLI